MVDAKPTAVVVFNPIAGGGRGEHASRRAEARLREAGYSVERLPTRDRRGATPMAQEVAARPKVVQRMVVVGGDGTLRETIEGLGAARASIPVGIVPMGNANVVAHELGIPREVEDAARTAVDGEVVPMDVGIIRGDGFEGLFLAMVGAGWDAHTVRLMDRIRHSRAGGVAYRLWADGLYGVAGLGAAFRPGQERFSLTVDGNGLPQPYCAAWFCNLSTYGKGMAVTPDAHRSSGRIHVQARKRALAPFLLWQLGAALGGARTPRFIADYTEGERIRMEAAEPVAVQGDGDDMGWTRTLEIGIDPSAVSVLVPRG